jgi:DNA-binding NarL/FixJ family response regulator
VFRTLIVDDEPIARRVLRDELAAYSDIEIVAEAEDGRIRGRFDSKAHSRSDLS